MTNMLGWRGVLAVAVVVLVGAACTRQPPASGTDQAAAGSEDAAGYAETELANPLIVMDPPIETAGERSVQVANYDPLPCVGGTEPPARRTLNPGDSATLRAGGHSLHIPQGAVTQRTTFTLIDIRSRTVLRVRANANHTNSPDTPVEDDFPVPLVLTISYSACPAPADPSNLRMVRVKAGGPGEDVNAAPVAGGLRAELSRLSDYILASPM